MLKAPDSLLNEKEMKKMGKEVGDRKLLAPAEDVKTQSTQAKVAQSSPDSDSETEKPSGRKAPKLRVPGEIAIGGVLISIFAHRELDGLGYSFAPKSKI